MKMMMLMGQHKDQQKTFKFQLIQVSKILVRDE